MKDIEPEKARQGRTGKQVLTVLLSSLALAALLWVALEIYGSNMSDENNTFANDSQVPSTTEPAKPAN